jgi:Ca2+-binding RTX toxin-like protein
MPDFNGTTGPDSWTGTSADEAAHGGDGADQLNGSGGNDQLYGEQGDDVLEGGAGIDQLYGGAGNDVIFYRVGSDYAAGELIDGGDGFDIIRFSPPNFVTILDLSGTVLTGIEGIDGGNHSPTVRVTAAQLDALTAASGSFTLTTGGTVSMAGVVSASPGGAVPPLLEFLLAPAGNTLDMRGFATLGSPTVAGDAGNDTVYGSTRGDYLYGGGGNDLLFGNDGDDILQGSAGIDEMHGGIGDDLLRLSVPGELEAGDILDGGAGFDRIGIDGPGGTFDLTGFDLGSIEGITTGTATARLTLAQFRALDEAIGSFAFADAGTLSLNGIATQIFVQQFALANGTNQIDFRGFAGPVRVVGGTGADTIIAGATYASFMGGDGNDRLFGSPLGGFLDGGSGDDLLYSLSKQSDASIALTGGDGNDGIYFAGAFNSYDSADGGAGIDTFAIQGNNPTLRLDKVDNFEVLLFVSGSDTRFGDTAGNSYSYHATSVDTNVAPGGTLSVNATGLQPGESLAFDGSAETNGNFRIFAGRGVDDLKGGAGNDGFFFGADGNLTAADKVTGGAGTDSIALRGNYALTFGAASFSGIEVLTFLSGHTNEYGGPIAAGGFDYDVTTADGNVAAGGLLQVIGVNLRADETLRFDGRAESDGSFRILSGSGNDTLFGGSGNDTLYGALGADSMDGGAGADTYLFRTVQDSTAAARDTIAFGAGDRIDLSLIDAIDGASANEAFSWIGANAFGHHAGELRAFQSGGQWIVEGDVNGDGAADFVLAVNSAAPLAASDFLL